MTSRSRRYTNEGATRSTFRAFGSPNFRRWFIGQTISQSGFWLQLVAQAMLVLELTGSGTLLGLVGAMQFIPVIFLGPVAGLLSDRVDKRRLLIATQTVMMTTAFILGILVLADAVTFTIVFVLATITGGAFAFDHPARKTIVTELVEPECEANAVSLSTLTSNGAKVVGPALAGLLIGTLGFGWCFIINGLSSIAVVVPLMVMDSSAMRRTAVDDCGSSGKAIKEGFAYAWRNRHARDPIIILSVVGALSLNTNVLFPLFVTGPLSGSAGDLGAMLTAMSVGSVAGTVWWARQKESSSRVTAFSALGLGVSLLALSTARTVVIACVFAALVGAASMVLFNAGLVSMQLRTTAAMRGRVMALFGMSYLGTQALGSPLSGWTADQIGSRLSIAAGGVAAIVIAVASQLVSRQQAVRLSAPA